MKVSLDGGATYIDAPHGIVIHDGEAPAPAGDPVYRVFVTRNYIACRHYDIKTTSSEKAKTIAVKFARKDYPDVRDEATDNGWIADEPIVVHHVGSCGKDHSGTNTKLVEIAPGVFHDPR